MPKIAVPSSLLLCTLALSSLTFTITSQAAEQPVENYWRDSSGAVVTSGSGECVQGIGGLSGTNCVAGAVKEEAPRAAPAEPMAPAPKHYNLSAKTLFDFDKSTLRPAGRRALDEIIGDIRSEISGRAVSDQRITVTGHTDSKGTDAYNQRLSERRAASVRDYLIKQGVRREIIVTRGMGKSSPVASNATAEGRQQNRRVEIDIEAVVQNKR